MQPNVLLIIADDHRHDAIHARGDRQVATPTLDRLAQSGTVFRQAHIMGGLTGAVCVPSRACLHTGAHVFNASAGQEMSDHQGLMTLPSTMPLLAEQFRAAGYQTFATGKWHNDRAAFARSFGAAENIFFGGMCDHHAVPLHQYDPDGLYPQAAARQGDGFSTDLFADAAQRFLQQHAGAEPFFLYLSFTAPHDPRTPPPRYAHAYDACTIDVPPNFAAFWGRKRR